MSYHPIHLPWTASLSVAWLHACGVKCVCAWPKEVPILGLPQPQERNWGPRNQGSQDSSLIPRNLLGLECGARNWSQPSPSTATFAPTPASLQRTAHHRSCQPGRTCANCGVGRLGLDPQPLQCPSPHPERMSSSGCGPYLTPSSLPVLQPVYLSPASCTSLACVPLAPVLFACSPSVQLLLCIGMEALAPSSTHTIF